MTDLIREEKAPAVCWFVGATYDGNIDQMPRFIEEGIWENGYEDKYLDLVKSIKAGDRIAIKAAYTRKHDLQRLILEQLQMRFAPNYCKWSNFH